MDSLVRETYNLFSDMDVLADPNLVRREWNLLEDPAERAKIREDITHRALEKIPTTREQLRREFKELLKVVDPESREVRVELRPPVPLKVSEWSRGESNP